MMDAINEFHGRLQALSTLPELRGALGRELESRGFDRYAYLVMRASQGGKVPVSISTYPDEWRRFYDDEDYLNFDPVLQLSAREILPFDWTGLRKNRLTSKKQRKVLDGASEFAIRNGITVPIHGPGGGFASLSVTASTGEKEFLELWAEHGHVVHLIGLYFHAAVEAKVTSDAFVPVRLTDREQECLLWTSRGKTAWETSEILKISEDTVIFHLQNVMTKMCVFSKHHAVVKAIMSGMIHP